MEFYHSIFGGDLDTRTFKEFHASQDPSEDDLVMHSALESPNNLTLMASDTPNRMEYNPGNNFSISISGDDEPTLTEYFKKL